MNLVWLLFSFNGRINRLQFWLGMFGAGVGGVLLFFVLGLMLMPQGQMPKTAGGALQVISSIAFTVAPVFMLLSWIGFALQVKRFHDRGRSAAWTMLPILPVMMIMSSVVSAVAQVMHAMETGSLAGGEAVFAGAMTSVGIWVLILNLINIFMFVDLGCMPGKNGPNKYGNPPGDGLGGGAPIGGAPVLERTPPTVTQSIPGMSPPKPAPAMVGSSLSNAESAIERAIAAHAKQTQTVPPRAGAQSAAGLRSATPGSFGRKVTP